MVSTTEEICGSFAVLERDVWAGGKAMKRSWRPGNGLSRSFWKHQSGHKTHPRVTLGKERLHTDVPGHV